MAAAVVGGGGRRSCQGFSAQLNACLHFPPPSAHSVMPAGTAERSSESSSWVGGWLDPLTPDPDLFDFIVSSRKRELPSRRLQGFYRT